MDDKIQKIGDRITFKNHGNYHTVVISPTIDKWKMQALIAWLIAWTLCGVALIYYLITGGFQGKELLVMAVMVLLWLYFEVRVVKAFLWRKFGLEILRIDQDRLTIKDSIFRFGEAKSYLLANIDLDELSYLHVDPKSYGKVMHDSFWQIGQGMLTFKYDKKDIYFGTQLENQEAAALEKLIKKLIRKYRKLASLTLSNLESDTGDTSS